MEINPSLARLRILEQVDSVQLQREAAPDGELAGCPGCPFFWSCPVPHRAESVAAPEDVNLSDAVDQLPARAEYRPRGADDIGWTDAWIEVQEPADDSDRRGQVDGVGVEAPPGRSARRGLLGRLTRR